jgi:SAM-dependent methyltransferase
MSNALLEETVLRNLLRCPECRASSLTLKCNVLVCGGCRSSFPLSSGRPILLRQDNTLFTAGDYLNVVFDRATLHKGLERIVPSPSVNLASTRVLKNLREMLDANGVSNVLVVGGGSQRVWLDPLLRATHEHRVVYSDIDSNADVDLFCDGHDLPFADSSFDAVVTTAVLEHVIYPERVVAELTRVLKTDGLVYSELPFMQQVHEGAYDFTRYTMSGHRRLFNHFSEIDAGMVAGPATAFVWALENLVLAFVRRAILRNLSKLIVRGGFSWIKYLDHFLEKRPEAMDGASCTYFVGRKSTTPVSDSEIIARYLGAKALRHV